MLNYRGNAFGQLGRFQEALADYREATEIFIKDFFFVSGVLQVFESRMTATCAK